MSAVRAGWCHSLKNDGDNDNDNDADDDDNNMYTDLWRSTHMHSPMCTVCTVRSPALQRL